MLPPAPWPLPDPLQPLKTLTTRVQPLTTPNAPSRSIPPPYRPKALDCHALEQAIGEGKAAELPAEDLKAAEAVLEKARAAEKSKCEKDLRDKMKARSLSGLTSHARTHSPFPRLNSFSYPSLHAPLALTARALAPNTVAPLQSPQATHYSTPVPSLQRHSPRFTLP